MGKKIFLYGFLSFFMGFSACKTNEPTPEPVVNNHITAKVDQVTVKADFKVILLDYVYNAYYPTAKYVEFQRLVDNGNPQGFHFKIENIDLENITFPYSVRYSALQTESSVMATYFNENDEPYGVNTNDPSEFELVILSFTDEVINCTFSGTLYSANPSAAPVNITDGVVNLLLVEY